MTTRKPARIWELHTLFLPLVATALIAAVAWVSQAAVAAHFDRLTQADGQRITQDFRAYSDRQFAILRDDLRAIRRTVDDVLLELRQRKQSLPAAAPK